MYEPLVKETHDKVEHIRSVIRNNEETVLEIRREMDINVSMLMKGKTGYAKIDEALLSTAGLGLAENFRLHNKDKLGDISFSGKDPSKTSGHSRASGTFVFLGILASLSGVQHVRDEALRKDRMEKQLAAMKQLYARDNEGRVFTIFKEIDDLTPGVQTIFRKLCSIVIPVTYAQKSTQVREALDTLHSAYLEMIDFRASVKKSLEILQDVIGKGKRELKEYSRDDFYREVYEYCDAKNLEDSKTPYYKRGIKEGVLYFVNMPPVIMHDKKWADVRTNLRHLYAKEYYKTLFLPAKRSVWRKYNTTYLDTLSYIHGRLNTQLKAILLIAVLMNVAIIFKLYPEVPEKIRSWYILHLVESSSKHAVQGQEQTDEIVRLAEIARRSDNAQNWKNLATALYEKERYSDAIDAYQQVLRLDPQLMSAYLELGICRLRTGDYSRAIDDFKKAREINPWNVQAYENAGIAYERGFKRVDLAIAEYEKAVVIDPKYVPVRFRLISCYRAVKNFQAALTLAQKTREIAPDDPQIHFVIGQILLWDFDRGEQALREYKKALELDPKFTPAYVQIGNHYARLKNYPRALEQYRKAITLDPKSAEAYVQLGICYEHMGNFASSLEQQKKAITLDTNNVLAYVHMGYCYEMLNKNLLALEAYRKAISINPNDAQVRYVTGMLLAYKLRRIPEGVVELETYLALEPDASNADDVRQKVKNLKMR